MASRKVLLIAAAIAMAVIVLCPVTAWPANNHLVVGDFSGWQPNPDMNYVDWASSVDVRALDTLEFVYDRTSHNVLMVNKDDYNNCDATNALVNQTWNSGDDKVQLQEAREYFFICGMADYCTDNDMKLAITVLP